MSLGNTPTPKASVPWIWLIGAIVATSCMVCPCGIGAGYWFGSGHGPAVGIPGVVSDSSVATEDMARMAIENRYKPDMEGGWIRVLTVRKTDGQSADVFGVKTYKMTCNVEVEFLKNWNKFEGTGWLNCVKDQKPGAEKLDFKKGEKLMIATYIDFEKSEKGWKARDK